MRVLSVDLETYSSVSIKDCGVFRYVESDDFEILLIGYAFDDEPVQVIDLTDPSTDVALWKARFQDWWFDPEIKKTAYNASFEGTCFSKWFDRQTDYNQIVDTMIIAATCGLPRSLGDVGAALGLPEDEQKDRAGKALIRYFCQPCKPTNANGGRTRNLPAHAPDKWKQFVEYNRQDVEAERAIRKKLERYEPDETEHGYWVMDQEINRRGVLCDRVLADSAIKISEEHTEKLTKEIKGITHLSNPNSVAQLKQWFGTTDPLNKLAVQEMLKTETGDRKRVLEIRQELGKSSIAKYDAMERYMCRDDRCRGLFQFYGANRTGRFAGRGVQLQNLVQNHIDDLETAREVARSGDHDALEMLYGNVPDTLSQLIRTAFIAKPGYTFAVADFSAIEARLTAWFAGEKWSMKTFREGKDVYCACASQMFGVPVEKRGVNSDLRKYGKIATLALGYGGNTGALINMGALRMGFKEEELPDIVSRWRSANPRTVSLWTELGDAAMETMKYGYKTELKHGVQLWRTNKILHMRLPGGRCIRYFDPKIGVNKFGGETITYQSYDMGKWSTADTWGGKLTENLIQATARDCLLVAMTKVVQKYPRVVMHIHDEMIVEVPEEEAKEALQYMYDCMAAEISWAPGLPLKGDGYTTRFYKKD